MNNYKKIVENALKKANKSKTINESVLYPENMSERMHPKLEEDLIKRTHSLGKHPIFPEGDESLFEEKIMGERFKEVATRCKRAFDTDSIDQNFLMSNMMTMVKEAMGLEDKHKKQLEKLAEKMIRDEYDMSEDIVEIRCELTPQISLDGTQKNPKPMTSEIEFKNHDEMVNANDEVYKRRFMNAMIQGAAKKCNHMFHMVDDELTDMDPRLPNKYSKMMAAADYMYYIMPEMENGVTGGIVRVEFPSKENSKPIIHAQAMVFPVLIHELVKGVMELISSHGLPKNKKIAKYVTNKADFLAAEPWDMRLGPALWERFTKLVDPDDFHLKHHIYTELASLPVMDFNRKMREIMAGTKEGKKIISGITEEIKRDLQEDEFNEAMNEISGENTPPQIEEKSSEGFDLSELLGDSNNENSNDESEGFDFDELL
jgi:hypothetical protein